VSVDIAALRTGLATNLASVSGLRVYPRLTGQVQPPAAVVWTGTPLVDRDDAMGRGLATVALAVSVIVSSANIDRAQERLDGYVDTVTAAILSDRTLSGACDDLRVPLVSAYEEATVGDSAYLATRFDVECLVDDS
jgi:hypothetical protein